MMTTHTALEVDAEGAVAWAAAHPSWFIFPGRMVLDPETGDWHKKPAHGLRWNVSAAKDPDEIRALWYAAGGRGVVCVACAPSNIWALDQDRDLEDEEWNEILDSVQRAKCYLVLKSCTKGRPHYIFQQGAEYVAEQHWIGGDVKASGFIVISSEPPIVDVGEVIVAPKLLLDKLKKERPKGGHGRGICSRGDMWDWLATTPDDDDLILAPDVGDKFIDTVIANLHAAVDDKGEHRRMAALAAVFQAAIEAAAGCYSAESAYHAVRDAYRALRESRGERGDRGWSEARSQDYDLMWQSLIPAMRAGDYADKVDSTREDALERYPDGDDAEGVELMEELMQSWATNPPSAAGPAVETSTPSVDKGEPVAPTTPAPGSPSPGVSTPSTAASTPSTAASTPNSAEPDPWPAAPPAPAAMPAAPAKMIITRAEPVLDEAAFWGPHGDLVEAYRGRTESCDVGMLSCLLAYAGAWLAGRAHFKVGVDVHGPNDFFLNIGVSSAARKSTAVSLIDKGVFYDPFLSTGKTGFYLPRLLPDVASGEMLVKQWMPTQVDDGKGGKEDEYPERRALMVQNEASIVWKRARREGSILGDVFCKIWDQSNLSTSAITSGSTFVPHDRHLLGFIGCSTLHVAAAAAKASDGSDAKSGFGNRFIWVYLPDSGVDLPFGSDPPLGAISDYQGRLHLYDGTVSTSAIGFGPQAHFDPVAAELWRSSYGDLKRDKGAAGFIESMCSRGESHVLRLALNYWLASGGDPTKVGVKALEAAIAMWRYAKESVEYIFGDTTGDKDTDNLVAELAARGGWATMPELYADLNKNSIAGLIKQGVQAGVLLEGTAHTGKSGRPPRTVCIAEWLRDGLLYSESTGVLRAKGTPLSAVTWSH